MESMPAACYPHLTSANYEKWRNGTLRSIEEAFGLTPLGAASKAANGGPHDVFLVTATRSSNVSRTNRSGRYWQDLPPRPTSSSRSPR